jgi:RNA polymerase sigma-70 factor (family 1)
MVNVLHNIKSGDIESFKLVYQHYHSKLYFYVLKHTQSAYLAEETVQITFIKLWENRHNLVPDIDLSRQIFRIAKSAMIDLRRKESRRHSHNGVMADDLATLPDGSSDELSKKEDLRQVYDTIEQMAPVRKKVFKLSRLEGLAHKEIAEQLSISPKTVENHIGRAIRQLKDTLTLFLF